MKVKRCEHVLWTIENLPRANSLRSFVPARLSKFDACFLQGKELWLKHVSANESDLEILRSAIEFFMVPDKEIAERLIQKGRAAEPKSAEWPKKLGHLYLLQMNVAKAPRRSELAKRSLGHFEEAVRLTSEERDRETLGIELSRTALEAGDLKKAESYANQLLSDAAKGEAMGRTDLSHNAHLVLGRIALQRGDMPLAKRELIAAGEVEGSPVLNSFGPGMSLARELLDKGERDVVIEYLVLVSSFWKSDRLKQWTATVRAGDVPDFGANGSR